MLDTMAGLSRSRNAVSSALSRSARTTAAMLSEFARRMAEIGARIPAKSDLFVRDAYAIEPAAGR
jgi:hypothetical protein